MLTSAALFVAAVALVTLASAVDVAILSVPPARANDLAKSGAAGSRQLVKLRAKTASLLATVWTTRVAGVTVAGLAAWTLAGKASGDSAPAKLLAVALAAIIIVLAQFAGKVLAQHGGERLALLAAAPAWLLSRTLTVVTWPAEQIVRLLAPALVEIVPGISDREIRNIVGSGQEHEIIEEHERRLIERAFRLDKTTAYDVMTPRVAMLAWSEDRTLSEIAPELRTIRYSRVPIYHESVDKITGVLYIRDAYQALISGQRDIEIKALAREPFFVPGSVTLDKLLLDFQTRRIHMGIVIDEYGGVDGLIALEDILEELVGEIVDESDIAEEPIIRLSRNEILVDGTADLREINHFFNTSFPLLEHRSLNGYLLDLFGQVPQPGERISQEGVLIEVTAATDTQVLRARLTRVTPGLVEVKHDRAAAEPSPPEPGGSHPPTLPDPADQERPTTGPARRPRADRA
ncbi:MAG: HlyC/CorC family transporter [Gemmatimonadota bacterium]|nr:MAG: HlyC/CorC family transporter [Gemmatimonadota bacterium]